MSAFRGLVPERFFYYFEALTKIPRGSGNEQAVSDYIVQFARDHGFTYQQDSSKNVKIWISATPGYENRKTIALQAHLDMVCACDAQVQFDFTKYPIDAYIEDGYVKAHGTTLGADDGAGVALILALLERTDLRHPPLQAIFTTAEEISCVGAQAMADSWIDCDYLIGLDYSNNKNILVGAAGMSTLECWCELLRKPLEAPANNSVIEIQLHGLQGGHSGNMIHRDRGNAIKIMGELLSDMQKSFPVELLSFTGGTLINVIAYEAQASVCCAQEQTEEIVAFLDKQVALLLHAYCHTEPHMEFQFTVRDAKEDDTVIPEKVCRQLLAFVNLCFAGAYMMVDDNYSRAESSANLGTLKEVNGKACVTLSIRSNVDYHHDRMIEREKMLAELCGLSPLLCFKSGAWEFEPDSQLLRQAKELYKEVYGKEAGIAQIHAIVEEGIFKEKALRQGKHIELINIGCMNYDVHTPKERLEIASVQPTYQLLCKLVENLR